MSLERYNKLLGAVLGTLALLGMLALGVTALVTVTSNNRADPGVLLQRKGAAGQPPGNIVYFCAPVVLNGTAYQLLPLAGINPNDPKDAGIDLVAELSGSLDRRFEPCGFADNFRGGRIFEVILRDTRSGKQSLVWNRPALLDEFSQASEECSGGKGSLPCGMRQWLVHDADTNGNGAIDRDDALVAFDMSATGELRRLTPSGTSILDWQWDPEHDTLLYTVVRDTNGDGRFTRADQTDILEYVPARGGTATSILDAGLTAQLLRREK